MAHVRTFRSFVALALPLACVTLAGCNCATSGAPDAAVDAAAADAAVPDAGVRTLEAWARSYEHLETALAILPVPGGLALVGRTDTEPFELAIVRTDLDGNLLWARRYPGLTPRDATLDTNDHIVVLGDVTGGAIGLATIDPRDGSVTAQRAYASASIALHAFDLLALPDGALAVTTHAGTTHDPDGVGLHVVLERDGSIRWTRRYVFRDRTAGTDHSNPMMRIAPSGLVVQNSGHVYALDDAGDVTTPPRWTGCDSLVATASGGWACIALRREDLGSPAPLRRVLHLVRLDDSLAVSSVRGYAISYFAEPSLAPLLVIGGAAATADDGLLVSLNASTSDTSVASLALVRFDAAGEVRWARTYIHPTPHVAGPAPDPYHANGSADGRGLDVAADGRIRVLAFLHGGDPSIRPERTWALDLPETGMLTFSSSATVAALPIEPDPTVTTVPSPFFDRTFETLPPPPLLETTLSVTSEPFTGVVVATDAP